MKHVKRLLAIAIPIAALFTVTPAADAASTTELAATGTLSVGNGFPNTAGMVFGGSCAGATASTAPGAGAGTCSLVTSGRASGTCTAFQGTSTGHIYQTLGSNASYSVRLSLSVLAGVLTVQGTAVDTATGQAKTVIGSGVVSQTTGGCTTAATFTWAGSLSIVG